MSEYIKNGINDAHVLPKDLKKILSSNNEAREKWNDITELARNEFICWIDNAKHESTRSRRVTRTIEELLDGQRRPCCWMGCIHRPDKQLSKTQQWLTSKKK